MVDRQFMLAVGIPSGAGLSSEVCPFIQNSVLKVGVYGKLRVPVLLGVHHAT